MVQSGQAKLLANKAKIDMYSVSAEFMDKEASRKDRLSDLASKQTILAKTNNFCILFDEADLFLQNQNNAVRNWEVSQVNEMLTWMESHEYPFVCTTNLLDTSFAQFEREVTGERIRDKFTASKKKGMWINGKPVMGYVK